MNSRIIVIRHFDTTKKSDISMKRDTFIKRNRVRVILDSIQMIL